MKNDQLTSNRRNFLKATGLTSLAFVLPSLRMNGAGFSAPIGNLGEEKFTRVNFVTDGLNYTPAEYLDVLIKVNQAQAIEPDFYAQGGTTAMLEAEFAKLTGKEKAVFLPTGTMANEIAISLLAGDKTKIVVPENSHIFRDEADTAAAIHNKRLVPAGKGMTYFDVEELDRTITYYRQAEVFRSGVGAVAIESPVRRADGTAMPLEAMVEISVYCKENGYGLHLDGARLHLASAWTGVPIHEYAALCDTVYISQYKYLNAVFGAVLCGDADFIDRLPHQNKIHGGAVFQTWTATAMALHHLQTIKADLKKAREAGDQLISHLNNIDGLSISPIKNGTNVYQLTTGNGIDPKKLAMELLENHSIEIRIQEGNGVIPFKVNASILRRPVEELAEAWAEAAMASRY